MALDYRRHLLTSVNIETRYAAMVYEREAPEPIVDFPVNAPISLSMGTQKLTRYASQEENSPRNLPDLYGNLGQAEVGRLYPYFALL